MNEDCSMQLSCVVCKTCTRPVGEIVTEAMGCDDGEECVRKDGVSHCQNGGVSTARLILIACFVPVLFSK